jgi:ferredoxin-type protein NapF
MTVANTRRAFFARFRGGPAQVRPPWSREEETFVELCTLCGDCAQACPTGLVVKGHAGYPIVDFRAASCTFCGACVEACGAGCFDRDRALAWRLKATIAPSCVEAKGVTCRMCGEACEAGAIRFRPRLGAGAVVTVDDSRCTGCGACVVPCPVGAIAIKTQTQTAVEEAHA